MNMSQQIRFQLSFPYMYLLRCVNRLKVFGNLADNPNDNTKLLDSLYFRDSFSCCFFKGVCVCVS